MTMEFDMTRPEEMARIISRNLRESGMTFAEAKRKADDAKDIAKLEPKLVSIAGAASRSTTTTS